MDRLTAAQQGATTYHGNPCRHGHDGERYVSDAKCVHCAREKARTRDAHFREIQRRARRLGDTYHEAADRADAPADAPADARADGHAGGGDEQ